MKRFGLALALTFVSGTSAVIFGYEGLASAAGSAPCANCQLRVRQAATSPLSSATDPAGSALPSDLISVFAATDSPIQFPTAPSLKNNSAPLWNGQGPLPGAWVDPWTFGKTDFDPSFKTSYWSEQSGPLNVPGAPWRQGMASHFADEIYGYGMVYVGTPYQAPLALDYAPLAMAASI
jgi:hypothetical protein